MSSALEQVARINDRVKACYLDLHDLLQRLNHFEKAHAMPSQEFFKKFSTGALAHETDFFEWYAYLDMSKSLVAKIRILEGELGNVLEQNLLIAA